MDSQTEYTDKTPTCFSCGSEIKLRVTTFEQPYMQDLVAACDCAEVGVDATLTPDGVNWKWPRKEKQGQ